MTATSSAPGVLVLRPAGQAEGTAAALRNAGYRPILFPTIEIVAQDPASEAAGRQQLEQLDHNDWLVFISRNAVEYFMPLWQAWHRADAPMPRIAAVGKATAEALGRAGLRVDLQPADNFSSEGLLESPAWQTVSGQQVLLVRGVGGRELLANTLRARGASVAYLEVYQRRLPQVDSQPLIERWSEDVDVVLATSNQLLDNLLLLVGPALESAVFRVPLVVVSERMQAHARELGFGKIWLAGGATDDQMTSAISTHLPLN